MSLLSKSDVFVLLVRQAFHDGLVHLGIGRDQDSHFDTRFLVSTENPKGPDATYVVSIAAEGIDVDRINLILIRGCHGVLVRKSWERGYMPVQNV